MAEIVLVESYPYESRYGGDPAYIFALADYLIEMGHRVHLRVTDIYRGRTLPAYRSAYALDRLASCHMRSAFRIDRYVIGFDPVQAATALASKLNGGRQSSAVTHHTSSEIAWTRRELDRVGPDAVILCFDAVGLAPHLKDNRWQLIALPSIIRGLDMELNTAACRSPLGQAIPAEFLAGLAAADVITTNTEGDARVIRQLVPNRRTIVVGMGQPFRPQQSACKSSDVVYVASRSAPNIESLEWLLSNVWPQVVSSCPNARLRLVGHIADAAKAPNHTIVTVGPVADVAREYDRAAVVVAPLIKGSTGLKTKVVEAISFGVPIVTTPIGVDTAFPRLLDGAALVADDPRTFADAITSVLRNESLQAAMREAAANVHARCFSPSACYHELEELITKRERRSPALSHR